MKKVIISLAPVSAGHAIDYVMLKEDIVQSVANGAAVCHMHSRNSDGEMTKDCTEMIECFDSVLKKTDVIVQASTGGISNMTIEERCNPLQYNIVESCSLNGGSTNLGEYVYQNSFSDIRYVAQQAYRKKIYPEIEVFDIGMIQAVEKISQESSFMYPKMYDLVFGHSGGMLPTIENLITFRSFVPKHCLWSVTHFGRKNWNFLGCAIAMGASLVRIGFEDSDFLSETENAVKNYQLVSRLRQLIESLGYSVATVKEAREILQIL